MNSNHSFWSYVDKTADCWNWLGYLDADGYGQFRDRQIATRRAHRIAWILTVGPLGDGDMLCHACDNRRCVNPAHMFVGTQADNIRDRQTKGRAARGERNSHARLSADDVAAIRADYLRLGKRYGTLARIARIYGVQRTTINEIVKGRTWKHLGHASSSSG